VVTEPAPNPQAAPGALEQVRELLNSWLISNDSREPTDRFDDLARRRQWSSREAPLVRALRDDLRLAVEGDPRHGLRLNTWIDRLDMRPVVIDGVVSYRHAGGPAGDVLVTVLESISAGTWPRLKACPDCRWVFYDHTRNGSKRWCLMYAGGPSGRACGSIAKMRRYRNKASASTDTQEGREPGIPLQSRTSRRGPLTARRPADEPVDCFLESLIPTTRGDRTQQGDGQASKYLRVVDVSTAGVW
jgi:hypothetical protein